MLNCKNISQYYKRHKRLLSKIIHSKHLNACVRYLVRDCTIIFLVCVSQLAVYYAKFLHAMEKIEDTHH